MALFFRRKTRMMEKISIIGVMFKLTSLSSPTLLRLNRLFENDIINNKDYAVIGGGKVTRCFIAYNNGSAYVDDTGEKGKPDSIFSSSSSGMLKQIFNVDYINDLTLSSVLRY